MNYAEIKKYDIANGEGVRVSLFVSGCRHHCKGCFNAVTWDFDYGKPFDEAVEEEIIDALKADYIAGLTILGGEPMEPENQRVLLPLLKKLKKLYPDKTVWVYSGYLYDELMSDNVTKTGICPRCEATDEMLSLINIMVDGEFVEAEKDITLRFKGSRNQRLLKLEGGKLKEVVG